jgi:hypothetical protein
MDIEDQEHFKTIARASVAPLTRSANASNPASNTLSRHDQSYLANKVALIFSCYRKDEAHDAQTYAQAVMLVLSDYPKSVVDHVIDPRTGILGTLKWLPTMAEIKEACETAYQRVCRDAERAKRIAAQLAERETNRDDPEAIARRQELAAAWLQRTDEKAKAFGQKPKTQLTAEEKNALLDHARVIAAGLNEGMITLSDELREIMRQQDESRALDAC